MNANNSGQSFRSKVRQLKVFFLDRNLNRVKRIMNIIQNFSAFLARRRRIGKYKTEDVAREIDSLNKKGYVNFVPSDKPTKELIQHCLKRFRDVGEANMIPQEGKKFYKDSIGPEDYEPSTPFMEYALDERILKTVGGYLGCTPYLQSIELIYSTVIDAAEPLHQTHLYHKDKVDKKIVKLFTYITDVDSYCGPLTILPLATTKKVPWYVEFPHYITDEVLSKYVDLSEAVEFIGSAGSALMADTKSLFHCGSRCRKPRLTFVAHYNSGFSWFPRNQYHGRWRENSDLYGLSKLQELALT